MALFWTFMRAGNDIRLAETLRNRDPKQLEMDADRALTFLDEGGTFPVFPDETDEDLVYAIAVWARACDRGLTELILFLLNPTTNFNGGAGDWIHFDHPFGGNVGNAFIAIKRAETWFPKSATLGRAQTIDAILYEHMVYPCRCKGFNVRIHRISDEDQCAQIFVREDELQRIGYAGSFTTPREWPLDEATGKPLGFAPDQGIDPEIRNREIDRHLSLAREDDANLIVLPELMTTREIQIDLETRLLDANRKKASALIVAGSYHGTVREDLNGTVQDKDRNRAKIILDTGRPVLYQDKMKSHIVPGFKEAIDPADVLNILITPMGPVFVAICRDFLDDADPSTDVLRILGLNTILVPSMGHDKTQKAHVARLSGGGKLQNWRAIIAQQGDQKGVDSFLACWSEDGSKPDDRWIFGAPGSKFSRHLE
jgi:predicted amidohydrolase